VVLVEGLSGSQGLADVQITGNRIGGLKAGVWLEAPLASTMIRGNQIDSCGVGIVAEKALAVRELAIDDNQLCRIETAAIFVQGMIGKDEFARTSVRGNQFDSANEHPGVMISCRSGDIVFADNHGVYPKCRQPVVLLEANTLVVTSNRIRCGGKSSMELRPTSKSSYTAVGNLTSGAITRDGGSLEPMWIPLNPIFQ
jgi:hypothetical protein